MKVIELKMAVKEDEGSGPECIRPWKECRCSAIFSSWSLANPAAWTKVKGWRAWTSQQMFRTNLETKQLRRNGVGKPIIILASILNWDKYSLKKSYCVSLKMDPMGSSYYEGEKQASRAWRRPDQEEIWSFLIIHRNQASARPFMEKEAITRHSGSGVVWYLKNWLILKIQPEGSDPSNLGALSIMRGRWDEGLIGCGFVEEDEGEGDCCWLVSRTVMHWMISSRLVVMWSWLEANLAIASSMHSILDFEWVDSSMVLSMKAPRCYDQNYEKDDPSIQCLGPSREKVRKKSFIYAFPLEYNIHSYISIALTYF